MLEDDGAEVRQRGVPCGGKRLAPFDHQLQVTIANLLKGGAHADATGPERLIQFAASVGEGLWYARSEAFMQQPLLQTLRWVRTFADLVFIGGALAMAWQVVLGLRAGSPAVPPVQAGLRPAGG